MAAMVWSWDVSATVAYTVYAALVFIAGAITVIYLHIKDPTFHQVSYALLTALVLARSIYLLHTRVDNAEARKNMLWTIVIGVSTFLIGFLLWGIDNEFCDVLRSIRGDIGIPWAFLLGTLVLWITLIDSRTSWMVVSYSKFHFPCHLTDIFRHILTGLGVYYYIQFLLYLRLCMEGNRLQYNFVWAYGFLPHIDRKGVAKGKGKWAMNGIYSNGLKNE